jgi:hypothetical protein
MGTAGFLSQLGFIIGAVAALLVAGLVLKALWAEIGPMIALLFRREPLPLLSEDDERR